MAVGKKLGTVSWDDEEAGAGWPGGGSKGPASATRSAGLTVFEELAMGDERNLGQRVDENKWAFIVIGTSGHGTTSRVFFARKRGAGRRVALTDRQLAPSRKTQTDRLVQSVT